MVSLLLSIVFHYRGRKEKEPLYCIRSTNVIQDFSSRFEFLELLHSGKRIENLTVTKILFWNGGRETISSGDVPATAPLEFIANDNVQILDAKILEQKNSASDFEVLISEDRSRVSLIFDYLDKGDGCVIQLLHTGKSSKDIRMRGKIKGVGTPSFRVPVDIAPLFRLITPLSRFAASEGIFLRKGIFVLYFAAATFLVFSSLLLFETGNLLFALLTLVFALSYFLGGLVSPKFTIPSGFDTFREEIYKVMPKK